MLIIKISFLRLCLNNVVYLKKKQELIIIQNIVVLLYGFKKMENLLEMTNTIKFGDIGGSLGTRNLGAKIRGTILKEIETNEMVYLDFDEVNVVTNSFANECFGKLLEFITVKEFKTKIAFLNANDFVQRVIISAL